MPAKNTKDTENVREGESNPAAALNEAQAQNQPVQETPTLEQRANAEVANDVLHGRFGDFNVVRENLEKAGADVTAVMTVVNDRLAHGAPSAYRPNASQVLESARLGEWGDKNIALRVRAAGYSELDARHVETSLSKES